MSVTQHAFSERMLMRTFLAAMAATLLTVGCGASTSPVNPSEFYAPKLYADQTSLTISIPVVIAERDGKKSFVKLFELHGFSGNGPSMEQIVRRNLGDNIGMFDSEGDAFVVRLANAAEFGAVLGKLKCVEEVTCLAGWLKNSESILFKE